ncbi:MAG: hypothetical protein WC521_02075 [Bdellovibrionales bacterium]|jgi:hypothetical protein
MGRTSFAILIVALALIVFVSFPKGGESKADKRIAYWEQKLEKGVQVNSTKDQLLDWAKENTIEFIPSDEGRLIAKVEWVSGFGSPFLFCSEWNVMVSVTINPFDDVVEKSVYKVSACS